MEDIMKRISSTISFVLIVLLAIPQTTLAQATTDAVQGTWEGLKVIPPGDELVVDLRNGKSVKGRISSTTDTTLTLIRGKNTTDFDRPDILRVYRLIPRSTKRATLIGLGIGLGAGAVAGGIYGSSGDNSLADEGLPILVLGGMAGGVGALIGFLSSSHKRKVLIYENK